MRRVGFVPGIAEHGAPHHALESVHWSVVMSGLRARHQCNPAGGSGVEADGLALAASHMDGGIERPAQGQGQGAGAGKKPISADVRLAIVTQTAKEKPKHATHWSAAKAYRMVILSGCWSISIPIFQRTKGTPVHHVIPLFARPRSQRVEITLQERLTRRGQ